MTRIDSVRAAAGRKESVRHAAEVVAPYAEHGQGQRRALRGRGPARLAPKVSSAAGRPAAGACQYDAHLAARVSRPGRGAAGGSSRRRAAKRTRKAARQAADYTAPRVEQAVADPAPPPGRCARRPRRGAAAVAALRGQVTAAEIEKLGAAERARRARGGARRGSASSAWSAAALRGLEVVGQADQPRLAGRAPARHRGRRPREAVVGERSGRAAPRR